MTCPHRPVAAALIAAIAVSSWICAGCASMRTIAPATAPSAPIFGSVKAGDTVSVEVKNGQRYRFVVLRIENETLVSTGDERYLRGEIATLKRRSFSVLKTACLGAGLFFGGIIAAAVMEYHTR